jgi:hypothetical protein
MIEVVGEKTIQKLKIALNERLNYPQNSKEDNKYKEAILENDNEVLKIKNWYSNTREEITKNDYERKKLEENKYNNIKQTIDEYYNHNNKPSDPPKYSLDNYEFLKLINDNKNHIKQNIAKKQNDLDRLNKFKSKYLIERVLSKNIISGICKELNIDNCIEKINKELNELTDIDKNIEILYPIYNTYEYLPGGKSKKNRRRRITNRNKSRKTRTKSCRRRH